MTIDGQALTVNMPTLGGIVSVLAILAFAGGWYSSHSAFKDELSRTTQVVAELRLSNDQLHNRMIDLVKIESDDRQSVTNRLVGLEVDVKYVRQDVAEIKLDLIPKR